MPADTARPTPTADPFGPAHANLTSGKPVTVFVILDAARADYVRPDTMPFVDGLAKRGLRGSFESPPGFAQRTVLFSGRYPDTSGNFSAFAFDPPASPFRWVRRLGPLGHLVKPRKVLVPARWAIQGITKAISGAYHTDPAWIPPRYLPFFRPCEDMKPLYEPGALGAPSIFDLCRGHGLRFRYLAHPVSGDDEEVHRLLVREIRAGEPYDLYVAQLSATDQQGHVHGPFSHKMQREVLRDMDAKLASVHAALVASGRPWTLVLCGDHGMGPVHRRVDIGKHLRQAKARPGKDYVLFVNSTLAVLWYLTETGRREVEAVLPAIPGARPVDEAERKQRRIPTDPMWGHRMVAADPGVLFWPDYFHVTDSTIVGMHGYLDKVEETHGAAIVASSDGRYKGALGLRSLVDVFPTLCALVGVPVPAGQEGKSLLPNGAAHAPGRPLATVQTRHAD